MRVLKILRDLVLDEPPVIDRSAYGLSDNEIWWRERYSLFESRGYRLRDRLRPGWIPSFQLDTRRRPGDCEDSVSRHYPFITDATRLSDGSRVVIKKVRKSGREQAIATFLSSFKDPSNHCVPIIDSFADHKEDRIQLLVMPLLREFDSPPFRVVSEVVDFLKQTLEGIVFMHSNNVAHRDCSDLNIMLEASSMYPYGFDPILQNTAVDWKKGRAKFKNRSECPNIKYFFIDFGLSTHFTNDNMERLVTGTMCQANVPELSDWVPYDPFAVDIYLLGDVYQRAFIKEYSNVEFLKPLVDSMVLKNPSERPKADDALRQLEELVSRKSNSFLRWRLRKHATDRPSRFFLTFNRVASELTLAAKRATRQQ